MSLLTQKEVLESAIKIWNKEAYDYGVSGDKEEFSIIKISDDEVHIDSKGLLRDGAPSPNIILKTIENKDYAFSMTVYNDGDYMELAEPTVISPTKSLRRTLCYARNFIIDNIL